MIGWLVVALVAVLVVVPIVGRSWVRRRRAQQLQADHVRGLPAAALLLQIVGSAGAPPRTAIALVGAVDAGDNPLGVVAADLAAVSRRLELGADLTEAILAIDSDDTSTALVRVLDVLRRAEADGVELGPHLSAVVRELRRERATALDVAAQRLTISLLFPLVVCILPAFVLLAIVPLLLGALSNLPG